MAEQPIPISGISDPEQVRVQLLASGRAVHAPLGAIETAFGGPWLPGYNTNRYPGANESARLAALMASASPLPYIYRSDSHIGIIRDTAPLNYQGTRAAFVLQHRDTASGGTNELIPGSVFQYTSTGNGVVNAGADLSQSIWMGLFSSHTKTGDGSAHPFTAIGELGAYGSGLYNELGLFVGTGTNTGSLHGTLSGVEVLVQDSPNAGTNDFDTTMNAVIGRVGRWNGGSRKARNFFASSEGDKALDAILGVNTQGFPQWTYGIDLIGATFTTGQAIVVPNNTAVASMNAAGSARRPLLFLSAADETWVVSGATSGGISFANSALTVAMRIDGSQNVVVNGNLTVDGAANRLIIGSLTGGTSMSNPAVVLGKRTSGFSEFIAATDGAGGYRAGIGVSSTGAWDIRVGDIATNDLLIGALGALTLTGGGISGVGWLSRGAPVTKTADFTVSATETNLINNKSGSSCTVTLPTASSFPGREILIKTIQAQTTISASSNVIPLAGGAAGTAILAATAGKWALLVSNGTNWEIMAAA